MRNIYILPTDKPSNLFSHKNILFLNKLLDESSPMCKTQHIYITSFVEPKLDEWGINLKNNVIFKCKGFTSTKETKEFHRKIILTTDLELIKDGIQEIDGEFLRWFVAHPSCENVEVLRCPIEGLYTIIPKEEPQQIYYNTVGREDSVHVIKAQFKTQKEALDLANKLNKKFLDLYYDWNETLIKVEPKQETLEEAAEKYCLINNIPTDQMIVKNDRSCEFETPITMFVKGAKCQQERSYSEEEVKQLLLKSLQYRLLLEDIGIPDWFEQFKKK